MKNFAERVKQLREERGLTLLAVGKAVLVDYSAVGKWERGASMPSIEALVRIADFYGVTTDYLLGRTDY